MSAIALTASPVRSAALEKMRELRDEAALRVVGSKHKNADSLEWARLGREHKLIFILLAGLDDDTDTVDRKDWREFTEPERMALQAAIRSMHRSMGGVYALIRK